MLYDLADGPPPRGSLLESVFLMLAKWRAEARVMETRSIVEAVLAPHRDGDSKLGDMFESYVSLSLPYVGEGKKRTERDAKKALKEVSKYVFRVKPLWRVHDNRGVVSRLQKGADRLRKTEEEMSQRGRRRI